MCKRIIIILLLALLPAPLFSGNYSTAKERLNGYNKRYFVYVNKAVKRLYLIDNKCKVWRSYVIATGTNPGVKLYMGDNRTPSGIFNVRQIYQEKEPWYMPQLREKMKKYPRGSKEYTYYWNYYIKQYEKHKTNRERIKALNSVYLKAKDGHKKYMSEADLGMNAYGPVFILIDYPNQDAVSRYFEAISKGEVPRDKVGKYLPPGSGIAIHGTNDDPSLGNDASSGCVRMQNDDILELSNYVSEGTMVAID
ncbi:MAG: L,D-transpeptidase [Spirochaetia bacterium]|nr:L,D-transpeptidase [Spirochaetia bacterium]